MLIEVCGQVMQSDKPVIPSGAGIAGAFIANRHQRTSIKQQEIYQANGGKSRKLLEANILWEVKPPLLPDWLTQTILS
jgi:hypothetical protein